VTLPFFTIGHSTHSLEEFAALLKASGVQRVVDIRKMPGSRKFPQFDEDALIRSLPAFGITYEHVPAWAACAARVMTWHRTPMPGGKTTAFTAMPTTPARVRSLKGSRTWWRSAGASAAR